jgi:hypothetical protein
VTIEILDALGNRWHLDPVQEQSWHAHGNGVDPDSWWKVRPAMLTGTDAAYDRNLSGRFVAVWNEHPPDCRCGCLRSRVTTA